MQRMTPEAQRDLIEGAFETLALKGQVATFDPSARTRVDEFEAQLQDKHGPTWASLMDEVEEIERELLMQDARDPRVAYGQRTLTLVIGQTTATAVVQGEIEAERRPQGGALLVSGWEMDALAAGEGYDAAEVDPAALTLALAERAMKAQANVVVTPSPTTEEEPLALIEAARRNGYQVEVAVLAVNSRISATQAFQRALTPIDADKEVSDARLAGEAGRIGKVLRRIEANAIADRITIYDRHGQAVDREKGQTASEIFEKTRGALSGAEKIRVAAAWEEVAEAYERNGYELPENAQRMREQAHYAVRQAAGTALNFDDRHPEHKATSEALAERYGAKLVRIFDAGDKAAVSQYPELTNAFVVKHVAEQIAATKGVPEVASSADERIREALASGRSIRPAEFKVETAPEVARSTEEIER